MPWPRSVSSGVEGTPERGLGRARSRTEADVEKDALRAAGRNGDGDGGSDSESQSSYSSPPTSSSNSPMLKKVYRSRQRATTRASVPNNIMRWLCLGLAATMVLFMLSLVRLSWASAKQVEIAIEEVKAAPAAPPVWQSFPFLLRYYGGIRSLVSRSVNVPEYPSDAMAELSGSENSTSQQRGLRESIHLDVYPDYTSAAYIAKYGAKVDCFLDAAGTVDIPRVRVYEGVPRGFPDPVMGSNEMLGIRNDVCYDRFGRLGPYGLGYSLNRGGSGAQQEGEREGADAVWQGYPEVDFRQIKWAEAQERCVTANKRRFQELPTAPTERFRTMQVGKNAKRDEVSAEARGSNTTTHRELSAREKLPRTAVLIRTWWDYPYTPEDLIYLRSIVSELSLLSGGEYTVHFLVQVKDDNQPIWSDQETYDRILNSSLPAEFRGMGTLWTERQMGLVYGGLAESFIRGLSVHGVYRSTFMPLQYFALQHPEYDYFWNWEMDVRYTGHWYHLFHSVSKWAAKQPRKFLWERNSRFYVPAKHGSWEDFSQMVRFQTEKGTNSANNLWSGLRSPQAKKRPEDMDLKGDRPIWGPERPFDDIEFDSDPVPPTSHDKDRYTWGVGEEADLITFNPLFDPHGTEWLLADDTTGYDNQQGQPPRRTVIITASRLSRRLLMTMHRETALKGHTMFSEMWPASCALHHGLKAVYVPHGEYIERKWPLDYLETVFNGGRNGATGGARTSVFSESRQHNFRGMTWHYNAEFPHVLYHRWLGYRQYDQGGEQFEVQGEGRMCLPAMLLHPIKRVDLVQEGLRAD